MARLLVYKTPSGYRYGKLSAVYEKNENEEDVLVSGSDKTEDYAKIDGRWFESIDPNNPNDSGDTRTWLREKATEFSLAPHEYVWSFKRIVISYDIERIGDYCFSYFENADFTFKKPANIKHLGKGAFSYTAISGKVALPGLEDATFGAVFSGCTKLTEVDLTRTTGAVTAIGESAFGSCHNLKKLTGCGGVETIGDRAFVRCTSLTDIDLNPDVLDNVGYAAFHISGIGESLDNFSSTTFADNARRKDKFEAQTLTNIQSVVKADIGGLPKAVCEQSYPDIPYGMYPVYENEVEVRRYQDYMSNGCLMLSIYHAYQVMFPNSGFDNFPAWWNEIDKRYMMRYPDQGKHIWETERYELGDTNKISYLVLDLLGLKLKDFTSNTTLRYPYTDISCPYHYGLTTHDETAKSEIWDALSSGYGVIASISTGKVSDTGIRFPNTHAVAIVGFRNGKLLVVDSASIDGERGGVYEIAYEDLFMGPVDALTHIRVVMPKS